MSSPCRVQRPSHLPTPACQFGAKANSVVLIGWPRWLCYLGTVRRKRSLCHYSNHSHHPKPGQAWPRKRGQDVRARRGRSARAVAPHVINSLRRGYKTGTGRPGFVGNRRRIWFIQCGPNGQKGRTPSLAVNSRRGGILKLFLKTTNRGRASAFSCCLFNAARPQKTLSRVATATL